MNWVNDLGAPAAVTAIDLITESYAPTWNEYASYGCVALGYGLPFLRMGNQFTSNMGIAAFPWAAKKIYSRVRGISRGAPSRLNMRPIRRQPGITTTKPEFAGNRLV